MPSEPMTSIALGLSEAPADNRRTEKAYERHSTTATFTLGDEAYILGTTTVAAYSTEASSTGEGLIVRGDAWLEYTFRRVADEMSAESLDPVRYTWHIDTTPGSTVATQPPALNGNPFWAQIPGGATPDWDQVEVTEKDVELVSGIFNDTGLEYAYTSESRSNITTVTVIGAAQDNGISVSTIRTTGDYSNRFTAGDWAEHANLARQGWMTADNKSSGTFAQNLSVAATYANGIAISRMTNGDGRSDGADQTRVTLRAYTGERTDATNSLFGQIDRVVDISGTSYGQNETKDLKLVPSTVAGEWRIYSGSQTAHSKSEEYISEDSLKIREDYQRTLYNPDTLERGREEGYDQTETSTRYGSLTTQGDRTLRWQFGLATPTVDLTTRSSSFNRIEHLRIEGSNTTIPTTGNCSRGTSRYDFGADSDTNEKTSSRFDAYTDATTTTDEWEVHGTDKRYLRDKGYAVVSAGVGTAGSTTEYDNVTDLTGSSTSTGKVETYSQTNPALASIASGSAMTSSLTADTFSEAKLEGSISVAEKTYGPNRFTVDLKKKTTFGDGDNVRTAKTTGLSLWNGKPLSGTVFTKTVLLGKDTVDRRTTGTVESRPYGWSDLPANGEETIDLTESWWGEVTAGSSEKTVTYIGANTLVSTKQIDANRGGYTISGSATRTQTEPTRTVSTITYEPGVITPDAGKVSGTFNNFSVDNRFFIDGRLTNADYLINNRSESEQSVTRRIETDLSTPTHALDFEH